MPGWPGSICRPANFTPPTCHGRRLSDELLRLAPAECICSEAAFQDRLSKAGFHLPARDGQAQPDAGWPATLRPDWTFDPLTARKTLHEQFGVLTMSGFGFDDGQPCLIAAGAIVQYLQETLKAKLAHLIRLRPYHSDHFMLLDEVTRRSLELTQNAARRATASARCWPPSTAPARPWAPACCPNG